MKQLIEWGLIIWLNMQNILAKASKGQNWTSDIKTGKAKLDASWKQ